MAKAKYRSFLFLWNDRANRFALIKQMTLKEAIKCFISRIKTKKISIVFSPFEPVLIDVYDVNTSGQGMLFSDNSIEKQTCTMLELKKDYSWHHTTLT